VQWLLNRSKIPSVFYLGAYIRSDNQGMKAHAWISVGRYVVIGAPEHRKYKPVATFTSPSFSDLK